MHLSQIHIGFFPAMHTRNRTTINNRKIQLDSKQIIYTTFRCARIYQGAQTCYGQYRWPLRGLWIVVWIKADVDN